MNISTVLHDTDRFLAVRGGRERGREEVARVLGTTPFVIQSAVKDPVARRTYGLPGPSGSFAALWMTTSLWGVLFPKHDLASVEVGAVFGKWMRVVAVGVVFALVPAVHAWERIMVLEAIHQVENPNDSMRIGPRGELGPFQFRPAVWNTYTQKPFSLAADRAEAQTVAELHFEWIKKGLERNKLEVSPYYIGLVWNAGMRATLNGRASAHSQFYAERVANLVEHAVKTSVADTAPAVEKSATTPTIVEAL